MPRYLIIGAGAVGGALGGRLTVAARDTVLVARGAHLASLQANGLRLRTSTEDLVVPVRAVGGPSEVDLRTGDILVFATKTQQLPELLPAWADAAVHADGRVVGTAGGRLPILLALNGVASETMALRYFARVYGVCVWMPAVHLVPGEVIIRSGPRFGLLHIGRVPAPADAADERLLHQVRADWTAANIEVRLPADVMRWKYRKLISNLGNVFQALVGSGDVRPLVALAEREARAVLDAAEIGYASDAEEASARAAGFTMHPVPGVPDDVGGSTWQSLARRTGSVETDYLNGEIALIAHQHRLVAPVNTRLAALARAAATRGEQPGALTADELAELLGGAPDQ